MTIDLNVGSLLTGAAAIVGVVITALTAFNSRSRLHKVAQQSMELASSLNEQVEALPVDSAARSRAKGLYSELVFQSHYAAQRYSQVTTPKALTLFDAAATSLLFAFAAAVTWNLRGIPSEWELGRTLIGCGFLIWAVISGVRSFKSSQTAAATLRALDAKAKDHMEEDLAQKRSKRPGVVAGGLSASAAALFTRTSRKRNQ